MALAFPIVIEGLLQGLRKRGFQDADALRRISGMAVAMGVDTVEDLHAWAVDPNNGLDLGCQKAVQNALPPPGKKTIGGYRLLAYLASGGMGTAWLAMPPDQDENLVVVKTLKRTFAEAPDLAGRFEREARITQAIRHPNVVACLDAGRDPDGTLYLALEFVAGGDLRQLLARRQNLAETDLLQIGYQAAMGLDAAEKLGVVHRDIKPGNLFISAEGMVKVADFGLARSVQPHGTSLTQQGTVLGTPAYMAPEQILEEGDLDVRCDLYALGITLFEGLAGKVPYENVSPLMLMRMQVKDPVPDLRSHRSDVDAGTVELLRTCLAKKRTDRYQHAADLAKAVAKILRKLGAEPGAPLPAGLVAESLPKATNPARYRSDRLPASSPAIPAVSISSMTDLDKDSTAHLKAETRSLPLLVDDLMDSAIPSDHRRETPETVRLERKPSPPAQGDMAAALAPDWLALIETGGIGHRLLLFARSRLVIGKLPAAPTDICLRYYPTSQFLDTCMKLSRGHAEVALASNAPAISVMDLGSTNGTQVDGKKLAARTKQLISAEVTSDLLLAEAVALRVSVIARRETDFPLTDPSSERPSVGLESTMPIDGAVLTRPHNCPHYAYAMLLRRLVLGGAGADLILPGSASGRHLEIARLAGRWLWRPATPGPWTWLTAGTILDCGGVKLLARAGEYALYDD